MRLVEPLRRFAAVSVKPNLQSEKYFYVSYVRREDEDDDDEEEEETSFAYIITYDYIICMLKSCGKKASY